MGYGNPVRPGKKDATAMRARADAGAPAYQAGDDRTDRTISQQIDNTPVISEGYPEYDQRYGDGTVRTGGNDPRRPIDAETLLQWAFQCIGELPWLRTGDRDLMFGRGLTARPRRRPPASWVLAEACAGVTYQGRPLVAHRTPPGDAAAVIEAVRRLSPAEASLVIHHARQKTRPALFAGAELSPARRDYRVIRHCGTGRAKRTVPPYCALEWSPSWEAICRAREDYERWHAAITDLVERVADQLSDWRINGFAAPRSPYRTPTEETA